ncbi:MAG: hypothetical protein WCQ99_07330 [Pseudomonadota bacterium]
MKNKNSIKTLLCLTAALMLFYHSSAQAGNIDPNDNSAQWSWGENTGWYNFDPSQGSGVTVGDSNVTGFVWAENIGWINLSPSQYGGVTNDGYGGLAGWAWGENVGWLSFSCLNTYSCATVDYGVTIDAEGRFDGYAWGENIGWVNFELVSQPDYKVQTSWAAGSTLITLASFTATPKAGKVILKWSTASEIDNAGFNLYRSTSEDGDYIKINAALIPAVGSATQGASYDFIDDGLQNRKTYYYKLEDIDLNGTATMHGPVSATPRLLCGLGK